MVEYKIERKRENWRQRRANRIKKLENKRLKKGYIVPFQIVKVLFWSAKSVILLAITSLLHSRFKESYYEITSYCIKIRYFQFEAALDKSLLEKEKRI